MRNLWLTFKTPFSYAPALINCCIRLINFICISGSHLLVFLHAQCRGAMHKYLHTYSSIFYNEECHISKIVMHLFHFYHNTNNGRSCKIVCCERLSWRICTKWKIWMGVRKCLLTERFCINISHRYTCQYFCNILWNEFFPSLCINVQLPLWAKTRQCRYD